MLPVSSYHQQTAPAKQGSVCLLDSGEQLSPPAMSAAHHAAPATAFNEDSVDSVPHPVQPGAVEDQAKTLQLLEAHDLAARAAATAAGFIHLGESVPQAVKDAQLVMDAPGSVDADSGVSSVGQSQLHEAQHHVHPSSQQDLAHAQLPSPPVEVVRQVLLAVLGQPGSEQRHDTAPQAHQHVEATATPAPTPAASFIVRAPGTGVLPAPRPAGGMTQGNMPDSSVASVAGSTTPSIDPTDWAAADTSSATLAAAVGTKQAESSAGTSTAAGGAQTSLLRAAVTAQATRAASADKASAGIGAAQLKQEGRSSSVHPAPAEQPLLEQPAAACLAEAEGEGEDEDEGEQEVSDLEPSAIEQGGQMMQLAAHMLGAEECSNEQAQARGPATTPSTVPAQLIGGTGLGAHSGGSKAPATGSSAFEGAAQLSQVTTGGTSHRHVSTSLPATPHPTPLSSVTPALLTSMMGDQAGQTAQPMDGATRPARDRTPARARSLGPEDLISPAAAAAASAGMPGLRLRVPASPALSSGSAPPSITSCGGIRRPPTPVPSRRSSSSLASPMHSARASHTSFDDEVTDMLPALEEEGAMGSGSSSSARLQDALPEWYTPSTSPALPTEGEGSGQLPSELSLEPALPMFYPPPPEEAQQMVREGTVQSPHANAPHGQPAAGSSAEESRLVTPHSTPMDGAGSGIPGSVTVLESQQSEASTAQVLCSAARQLEHEAAESVHSGSSNKSAVVGAASQQLRTTSSSASDRHAPHPASPPASTGVPQMDAQPASTAAVYAVQEQMALHSYMGRAAAIAGALVHSGQTPARAANLAEAAMDPADVVDFTDARTNLAQPDTLPDMVAAHTQVRTGSSAAASVTSPTAHMQHLAPRTPERAVTAAHVTASVGKPVAPAAPAAAHEPAEQPPLAAMVEAVKGTGAAATEPVLSPPEGSLPGTARQGRVEGEEVDSDSAAGEAADTITEPITELSPGWTEPMPHIYKARVGGGVVWERHQDEELDESARLPRAPPPSFIEPRATEPEGGRSYSFQVHGAHAAQAPSPKPPPVPARISREPDTPPSSPTHLSFTSPSGQPGPGLPRLPSRLGSILGGVTPSGSFANTAMASFSAGLRQSDDSPDQEAEMEEAVSALVEEEGEGEDPASQHSFPRLPPLTMPAPIITPREPQQLQAVAPLTPPQGLGQHANVPTAPVPKGAAARLAGDGTGTDMLAIAEAAAAEAGLPPPSPTLLKQLQQQQVFGRSPSPLADEEIPRSRRAATPPSDTPDDATEQQGHTGRKESATAGGGGVDAVMAAEGEGGAGGSSEGPAGMVLLDVVSEEPRSPRTPRSEHELVPL